MAADALALAASVEGVPRIVSSRSLDLNMNPLSRAFDSAPDPIFHLTKVLTLFDHNKKFVRYCVEVLNMSGSHFAQVELQRLSEVEKLVT